jgi:hypothetical protein
MSIFCQAPQTLHPQSCARWCPPHARPGPLRTADRSYDLSWFDKLRRAQFRDGRIRLGCLTGGKPDDVTVLVAVVEDRPAWA